jgi:Tol biopolymer transport system component
MPLQNGSRLGSYEILALLSSGTNGEIYKASDTRANRAVTIKLLPSEAVQHLKNQAHAISSLKHPHICALYDVGEQDGAGFVVTEYVEGQTLAERLAQGPMELEEALKTAIAMADALHQAHRGGVTHRGLNPSSVMLTPTGVKLMDFGLANPAAKTDSSLSATSLPTRTAAASLAAVPVFAAPYLAPEQWEGKGSDARTDIFAMGAILYQMIAGRPAFEGKTPALLIAAIETIDPDPLSKVQPMAPAALDYVVKRCLAKDPKQRLQTALDLKSQLQWIAEGGSQVGIPAPIAARRQKTERLVWIALAVALVLILGMAPATYRYFRGSPEPEEVQFVLTNMGSTGNGGPPASISPDGRWIVRSQGGSNLGLDAVILNSVTHQVLVRQNVVTQPFWSPDSRSIAFLEDGKLKAAEVAGGPARIVCDWPAPIGSGTWSKAGVILISTGGAIHRVMAAGGQSTPILTPDASKKETELLAPFFLSDGRHYLYLAVSSEVSQSAIYVGALDSKERTRLFASDSKAVFAEPGYIFFNRDGTVFAQPFNAEKLTLTGESVRIADNVPFVNNRPEVSSSLGRSASYGVSDTGVLTYRIGTGNAQASASTVSDRNLLWFDRAGARVGQVGGPAAYAGVDVSPDGKQVAVHVHDGSGGDSWFFDSAQGRMQRLTFNADADNASPLWSPDGTRIAFVSKRSGKWGLYTKPVNGSGTEDLIIESELPKAPMSWSPDGKLLVYWVEDPKTRGDVWAVPISGEKKPIPILNSLNDENTPQLSPDGKWIAYSSNETGRLEIYIKPFPEGPGKWQISTDGGYWPRWSGDGKELFFILAPNIMAAAIHVAGPSIQAGVPRTLFGLTTPPGPPASSNGQVEYFRYAVSADGQRFLVPQQSTGAAPASGSLAEVLATTADQGGGSAGLASNSVMVVLNWTQLLKRK